MRSFKKILLILLVAPNFFCVQIDSTKNAFEIELGGKGNCNSINYWRNIAASERYSLAVSLMYNF